MSWWATLQNLPLELPQRIPQLKFGCVLTAGLGVLLNYGSRPPLHRPQKNGTKKHYLLHLIGQFQLL